MSDSNNANEDSTDRNPIGDDPIVGNSIDEDPNDGEHPNDGNPTDDDPIGGDSIDMNDGDPIGMIGGDSTDMIDGDPTLIDGEPSNMTDGVLHVDPTDGDSMVPEFSGYTHSSWSSESSERSASVESSVSVLWKMPEWAMGQSRQEQSETETSVDSDVDAGKKNKRKSYDYNSRVSKSTVTEGFVLDANCKGNPDLQFGVYHNFGYDCYRRKNVHVVDIDTVIMVSGSYVRILNVQTLKSIYLRCTGTGSVTCLAVHPSKEFFASGESGGWPDINVFRTHTCELFKVLTFGTEREYVSLEFDPHKGDMLVAQGAAPDHTFTIWNWLEETPLLRSKNFKDEVFTASFCPDLTGYLVSTGVNHIRFWRMPLTFTGLKLQSHAGRFGTRTETNIEASYLFPDGKTLTGSTEGTLLLWDEGLLVAEFTRVKYNNCHRGNINMIFMHDNEVVTLGEDGFIRTWDSDKILYVEPHLAGDIFCIDFIEEIKIDTNAGLMHLALERDPEEGYEEEKCYVQDNRGKIWSMDLAKASGNKSGAKAILKTHSGPVLGCTAATKYELLATGGEDGSIRVFDCMKHTEAFCMQFNAPVTVIVWVPVEIDTFSSSIMAGFADGAIRKVAFCKSRRFVEVLEVKIEHRLCQAFRAHKGQVTSLVFSPDCQIMLTGSLDKTLFLFKIENGDFAPVGWIDVNVGITQLVWTPRDFDYSAVMAVSEQGCVVEVRIRDITQLDITSNYEITNLRIKLFKFHSIKSEHLHELELQRLEEERKRLQEEEEALLKALEEEDDALIKAIERDEAKAKQALEDAHQQAIKDAQELLKRFDDETGIEVKTKSAISFKSRSDIAVASTSSLKAKRLKSFIDKRRSTRRKTRSSPWKTIDKESQDWQPFIPSPPSPILQAVYAVDEGQFWLTLGGYDGDYLYLCQFPDKLYETGDSLDDFDTKPVGLVPVPNYRNADITCLKLHLEREEVLMGFSDGYIRLVQLDPSKDLWDISRFWEQNAHDHAKGRITGMEFGYNNHYLVTTAMDGNIFLFSQALKLENSKRAKAFYPRQCHHNSECEDITPQTLWFIDEMDRQKRKLELREATIRKEACKDIIRGLREKWKEIVRQNAFLPERIRLSPDELRINVNLLEEQKQTLEGKLEHLKRVFEWESEKCSLELDKVMKDLTRKEDCPSHFAVKAFYQHFAVKSFRVGERNPRIIEHLIDQQTRLTPLKQPSYTDLGEMAETESDVSSTEELLSAVRQLTRQSNIGLAGAAARTLNRTIKKAMKNREKRHQRQKQWEQLYAKKLILDIEDPKELEAIQLAKETIGDLKLKTDLNMALKFAERRTTGKARTMLAQFDSEALEETLNFNRDLMKLREEKFLIIQIAHAVETRLRQASRGLTGLKRIPMLTNEEVPEQAYVSNYKSLRAYQRKMDEADDSKPGSFESKKIPQSKAKTVQIQRNRSYFMGVRDSDYPEIAQFAMNQHDIFNLRLKFTKRKPLTRAETKRAESYAATPLEEERDYFAQMQYEHDLALSSQLLGYVMEEFDLKLRRVRQQSARVALFLARLNLICLEKLQEDHVDQDMDNEEKNLKAHKATVEEELEKNQHACNEYVRKIAKKTEENENITKQLNDLWNTFNVTILENEGSTYNMRYLTFLYKHRVNKKESRPNVDEDEQDSDWESASSSILSIDMGSDADSEVDYNLNDCPASVDKEIYNMVLMMQQERQNKEEHQKEVKDTIFQFTRELDIKTKHLDNNTRAFRQACESLNKFYQEKMTALNANIILITLRKRNYFTDIHEGLLLDIAGLKRLIYRRKELKLEIKEQHGIMNAHTRYNALLRRSIRIVKEKIKDLDQACHDEMLKKFGQIVDLSKLELVTINPKAEVLRLRMLIEKDKQHDQMKVVDDEVNDLKEQLVCKKDIATDYLTMKSDLSERCSKLGVRLNSALHHIDTRKIVGGVTERLGDRDKLCMSQVVKNQADVIESCWNHIHHLAKNPSRSFALVRQPLPSISTIAKKSARFRDSRIEKTILPDSDGRKSLLEAERSPQVDSVRFISPSMSDQHDVLSRQTVSPSTQLRDYTNSLQRTALPSAEKTDSLTLHSPSKSHSGLSSCDVHVVGKQLSKKITPPPVVSDTDTHEGQRMAEGSDIKTIPTRMFPSEYRKLIESEMGKRERGSAEEESDIRTLHSSEIISPHKKSSPTFPSGSVTQADNRRHERRRSSSKVSSTSSGSMSPNQKRRGFKQESTHSRPPKEQQLASMGPSEESKRKRSISYLPPISKTRSRSSSLSTKEISKQVSHVSFEKTDSQQEREPPIVHAPLAKKRSLLSAEKARQRSFKRSDTLRKIFGETSSESDASVVKSNVAGTPVDFAVMDDLADQVKSLTVLEKKFSSLKHIPDIPVSEYGSKSMKNLTRSTSGHKSSIFRDDQKFKSAETLSRSKSVHHSRSGTKDAHGTRSVSGTASLKVLDPRSEDRFESSGSKLAYHSPSTLKDVPESDEKDVSIKVKHSSRSIKELTDTKSGHGSSPLQEMPGLGSEKRVALKDASESKSVHSSRSVKWRKMSSRKSSGSLKDVPGSKSRKRSKSKKKLSDT